MDQSGEYCRNAKRKMYKEASPVIYKYKISYLITLVLSDISTYFKACFVAKRNHVGTMILKYT